MRSGRQYGVADVRKNFHALLKQAHRGQAVIVTKRGKPYAAIVPMDQAIRPTGLSLTALRGSGKGMWGRDAAAFVRRLRKEW